MTGSLGATGARLTKRWFTDLEVTNAIAGSVTGNAGTVTVADESSDTTCFLLFATADSCSLAPKTGSGLTINSSTDTLTATGLVGTTIVANTSIAADADDGATLGTASVGWSDLYLAAGGNILIANANAKRTIILSAAGGTPTTTAGCAAATKVEAGTNDVDYFVLDFDAATDESAFWNIVMPDNYDGSTITAKVIWTNAGGLTTETVAFDIAARAYADSDAIDQAFGTAVEVTDTWLAQGDIHISAASGAITIGGSPAGGQYVVVKVTRDVSEDTLTGDARLLAVHIEYGINSYSD